MVEVRNPEEIIQRLSQEKCLLVKLKFFSRSHLNLRQRPFFA
jgi:hypothetical protein